MLQTGPRLADSNYDEDTNTVYVKREPWVAPELYAEIVKAALDGARAIAAYGDGKMRIVSNAYIRVDIVLAAFEKVIF